MLTPRDVHNACFELRGVGPWRGYDTDQVDEFLDEVYATITALRDELLKYRKKGSDGTED